MEDIADAIALGLSPLNPGNSPAGRLDAGNGYIRWQIQDGISLRRFWPLAPSYRFWRDRKDKGYLNLIYFGRESRSALERVAVTGCQRWAFYSRKRDSWTLQSRRRNLLELYSSALRSLIVPDNSDSDLQRWLNGQQMDRSQVIRPTLKRGSKLQGVMMAEEQPKRFYVRQVFTRAKAGRLVYRAAPRVSRSLSGRW